MNLAIFGGSFDPIHTAHLQVARGAADALRLDRVLFVPAALSPFKTGSTVTSFEHRLRMVELAIADDPRFEASRLEEGTARSYSIDTVEKVAAGMPPGSRLFFIIGADSFAEIRGWHRWEDLIRLVEFIVVSRPGFSYDVPGGARVHRLDSFDLSASSTQVRRGLGVAGAAPDLTAGVREYIREHGIYKTSTVQAS